MSISFSMTNEEYHAMDALSASGAKTIAQKSLSDFKYGVRKHSNAFDVGTAAHTLVFEPALASTVWCGPETRRGKAWSEMKEEAEESGALLLTEADYKLAEGMATAVRSNKAAASLLGGDLVCEASVFAKDEIYGVDLRARPDGWRRDIAALIDLKTTISPDPVGFAKQCAQFGYHIQDAFYRRVMALEGYEIDRFIFISVGKEAPHHVGVYELDWRSLQEGEAATRYALEKYSTARKTDVWDYGYGELQTLQIPSWSFEHTQD
tara:strand:- start:543 stop:1334 length:792 start_codon:yes stop_codon:yes gene_type:complete